MSMIPTNAEVRNIFHDPGPTDLDEELAAFRAWLDSQVMFDPSPDDWDAVRRVYATGDLSPIGDSGDPATGSPADILIAWAAWHDSQAACHDPDCDLHAKLAMELRGLAAQFRAGGYRSVESFVRSESWRREVPIRLGWVRVPERRHHSEVAEEFDFEARRYLSRGTSLARLVAHEILGMAEQCEEWGVKSLREYGDRIETQD